MAAIYQADVYCDDCAEDIKRRICTELLAREGSDWRTGLLELIDLEDLEELHQFEESAAVDSLIELLDCVDQREYDSDEYPKGCDDDETSDSPSHCGSHEDCLNPTVLIDGSKVGHFFENNLTEYGEEYVRDTVCEDIRAGRTDSVACTVWAPYYDWIDWGSIGRCTGCDNLSEDLDEDSYCEDCAECMASEECDE